MPLQARLLHYSAPLASFRQLCFNMPCTLRSKQRRFPHKFILCDARWNLLYPVSYQDVVELLAERDVRHYPRNSDTDGSYDLQFSDLRREGEQRCRNGRTAALSSMQKSRLKR
jgi:hypothetical protein